MASKPKSHVLAGTFVPDKNEHMFNDTAYGAVVVHDRYSFNSVKCFGVIELCGTNEDRPTVADVLDECDRGPTVMTAEGARKLAALLIKAADISDKMNKDRKHFIDEAAAA